MSESVSGKRPKHLNLLVITLPLPGVISILHRVSGLFLILALPFLVWALAVAVQGPAQYDAVASVMDNIFMKALLLVLIWSLMHHLCAGIRFLFLEALVGIELSSARSSSVLVLAASVFLTLALAGALFL